MTRTSRTGGCPSVTGCAAVVIVGTASSTRAWTTGASRSARAAHSASPAAARPRPGSPAADRRGAGPAGQFGPSGYDQDRGYEPSPREYGERGPVRDSNRPRREPTEPVRRGSAAADLDATQVSLPRAAAARAAAPARRSGSGLGAGPAGPYDTGPSARVADFTPAVHADPDLSDSDVFPRVRADIPEPLAPSKPAKRLPAKGRGRPLRGKHDDDDDDWPSTEWDKMSDEQYWAELSADKPLATTARTAQPSSAAKSGAVGQAPPVPDRSAPAGRSRAERVATAAEPEAAAEATQQLDLGSRGGRRGRQADSSRPAGSAPLPAPVPPAVPPAVQPSGPARQPDQPRIADVTERLPVRPQQRPADTSTYSRPADTGTYSRPASTGTYAAPRAEPGRPAAAGRPRSAGDGYAGPGTADNDPLTSPSFSRQAAPANDSRSYRNPGRSQGDRSAVSSDRQPGATSGGYGRPADATASYASPVSGGYQAVSQDRTDPGLGRPAAGGLPPAASSGGYPAAPRASSGGYPVSPARTSSGGYPAAPRASSGGYPPAAPSTPAGGYPAAPPASPAGGYSTAPPAGWDSEDRRPSPVSSSQSGPGNPYGSFVDSAPPSSRAAAAPTQYPQGQTAPDGGYNSYPARPAASYPHPYEPPAAQPPAPDSTWYAAPPAPAAPAPPGQPTSPYSYGSAPATASRARHRSASAQDNRYPEAYPAVSQDGAGRPDGYRADPYGPEGYGGYHSRQS